MAPPSRSRARADLAGTLPETTTAATEAPAAASKASSHPSSTSTRSRRMPDHPVDARQQFGPGRTPGLVESPFEGVGPGRRPVMLQFGLTECPLGRFESGGGPPVGGLGLGHHGLQLVAGLLRLGQPLPQLVVLALQDRGPALGGGQPDRQLVRRPPVAFESVLEGSELAPGHGDRLVGPAELGSVPPGLEVGFELPRHLLLDRDQRRLFGGQRRGLDFGSLQLLGQPGPLGLEGRDHIGVGGGVEGLGQRTLPLTEHAGQPAGPFDHPLGPSEGGGQIGLALGGHLVGGPLGVGIELAERTPDLVLGLALLVPGPGPLLVPEVESPELGAGRVQAEGAQRIGEAGVRAGGGGLALEGPDLTLDFPDQVEEPFEVLLRRSQPALGPLAAAPVLEHPGRLFDDRPPVLGAGLQDGVEVALADDDVLLAAHAGIREQLLDVQEPARRAVDRVLAVPRPEEGPGDGDLGEVGAQLAANCCRW